MSSSEDYARQHDRALAYKTATHVCTLDSVKRPRRETSMIDRRPPLHKPNSMPGNFERFIEVGYQNWLNLLAAAEVSGYMIAQNEAHAPLALALKKCRSRSPIRGLPPRRALSVAGLEATYRRGDRSAGTAAESS
jgi:hypothetical protein